MDCHYNEGTDQTRVKRSTTGEAMKGTDPLDYEALSRQVRLQRKLAWDIEKDIPWELGVDAHKPLLPLDDHSIAFPGASAEQALALSQLMGLIVNSTISEMEDALPKLKHAGWMRLLKEFPVGPEMVELGELFFDEEAKHAKAFSKYLDLFCHSVGVERKDIDTLLPKAFGSNFQRTITANALSGGHAFWWVVASVEEVSIGIYHQILRNRQAVDPLYLQLHRRHLEEESRHANYAFLMLNLVSMKRPSIAERVHRKADFLLAQLAGGPWVIAELYKFFDVKRFKGVHPFFDTLASCIPLFEAMPKSEVIRRMFFAAPYVSWLLNPSWRTEHTDSAKALGAFVPWMPKPVEAPVIWQKSDRIV